MFAALIQSDATVPGGLLWAVGGIVAGAIGLWRYGIRPTDLHPVVVEDREPDLSPSGGTAQ